MTNNIYKLRIQSDLSQPDLAKELGMSFHSYRVIEHNYPNINTRIETLLKIADYYGVSLDYLCGRTIHTIYCMTFSNRNQANAHPSLVKCFISN